MMGVVMFYGFNTFGKCMLGCGLAMATFAQFDVADASTFSVVYAFNGYFDGSLPIAGLIEDNAGNLYGTTLYGGNRSKLCNSGSCGVVFKVAPNGTDMTLHAFKGGSDGANPATSLMMDQSGNLYGTTEYGGSRQACDGGCGTVFKVTPGGKETVLYSFQGGSDGQNPDSRLVVDAAGNLYGTTAEGGDTGCFEGCGTVYKLAGDGTKTCFMPFRDHRMAKAPVEA